MSTNLYEDRISGEKLKSLSKHTFPGQIQLASQDNITINSIPAKAHEYIFPDKRGQCKVHHIQSRTDQVISFNKELIVDEIFEDSIIEIGKLVEDNNKLLWSHIANLSHLVPKFFEKINLSKYEKVIAKKRKYLFEIFNGPFTQLTTEIEKVHIGKAIRIHKMATEYLSAHTEDWERRTFNAIQPQKLLTERVMDELNIYENRVAVRLVDHLRNHLKSRIFQVKRLLDLLDKAGESHASHHIYSKHTFRIYELLADSLKSGAADIARKTLRDLEDSYYKLGGLLDSPLYKSIPLSMQVKPTLMETNILLNDQNYRQMAALWRVMIRHRKVLTLTGAEIFNRKQDIYTGFDNFCLLLIINALNSLNLRPASDEILEDTPIEMLGRKTPISLMIKQNKTIELELVERGVKLHFVPLFSDLKNLFSGSSEPNNVISRIEDQILDDESKVIFLYPDNNHLKDVQDNFQSIDNSILFTQSRKIEYGALPVSPESLYSIEKIGRTVRQFIDGNILKNFAPEIDINNSLLSELGRENSWLAENETHDALSIIRPPRIDEVKILKKYLEDEIIKAKGKGKSFKDRRIILEDVLKIVPSISKSFDQLLSCPICQQQQQSTDFQDRYHENKTYSCSCNSCTVEWGLYSCSNCKQNFPYINVNANMKTEQQEAGWIDKMFGLDLIASPCGSPGEKLVFRCTNCNYCSHHENTSCTV
jgi:hypothetical protein